MHEKRARLIGERRNETGSGKMKRIVVEGREKLD
jgi:cobalamin-dependent methionine synthase I